MVQQYRQGEKSEWKDLLSQTPEKIWKACAKRNNINSEENFFRKQRVENLI